jgi:uncharacterized protein YjbJ (UPF0337 family)
MPAKWNRPVFSFRFYEGKISRALRIGAFAAGTKPRKEASPAHRRLMTTDPQKAGENVTQSGLRSEAATQAVYFFAAGRCRCMSRVTSPSPRRGYVLGTFHGGASLGEKMECVMDWNRIEGNWKQFKGQAKEKWGRLTDDDLDVINGRQEQLEGKIQERYGLAKDDAKREVETWYNSLP